MLGKSDHTIRQWHTDFLQNGEIPENMQGKYRSGIIWSSEELNQLTTKYIQENSNIKGQPNFSSSSFCSWMNEDLLPNVCLEPGFPRKISIETARLWMHHLEFEVLSAKKGLYFDGHERPDVIEECKVLNFIRKMAEVGLYQSLSSTNSRDTISISHRHSSTLY